MTMAAAAQVTIFTRDAGSLMGVGQGFAWTEVRKVNVSNDGSEQVMGHSGKLQGPAPEGFTYDFLGDTRVQIVVSHEDGRSFSGEALVSQQFDRLTLEIRGELNGPA